MSSAITTDIIFHKKEVPGMATSFAYTYCLKVDTKLASPQKKCFFLEFEDSQLGTFEFLPADRIIRYGNKSNFVEDYRDISLYFDVKYQI